MPETLLLRGAVAAFRPWTDEEEALVAAFYATRKGPGRVRLALPARSAHSIYHKAEALGLTVKARWTKPDDARLRDLWESGTTLDGIARALHRSKLAVRRHMRELGLAGIPPGWELLTHAAKRCGYSTATPQLRRILEWAGVLIRRANSTRKARKRPHMIVEQIDVDEALLRWHETEPIAAAARRLGVNHETLRQRLLHLGLITLRGGRHIRITDEQARAAIAACRGRAWRRAA